MQKCNGNECHKIFQVSIFKVVPEGGGMCTGIPHFIALRFIVLCRYCNFYKLKVCGNPAPSKPTGIISPIAFAHFMFVCHTLVILTIFQTFMAH